MPISHVLASAALYAAEQHQRNHCSRGRRESATSNGHETKPTITSKHPVLIDTDGGTEDAWALFMAVEAHKNPEIPFHIEAITCVHGTTSVENVAINVTRVLQIAKAERIPVYVGAEAAMVTSFEDMDEPRYNGFDGFGDASLPRIVPRVETQHAVNAIIELAMRHKGQLRILGLGPLTNLALAFRLKPEIQNCIKEVVILGGNVDAVGNATTSAEFNFAADAEAAHVVLSNFKCPMYILPWETNMKSSSCSHGWRVNYLGALKTEQMNLLNQIEAGILDRFKDSWVATDAVAAAVFIDPSVMLKKKPHHCAIELQGSHTRGMMVVDRDYRLQKPPNVVVISQVDVGLYQKMLVWAAGGSFYKHQ